MAGRDDFQRDDIKKAAESFEKARMRSWILPLAGCAAGLASVLCVLFIMAGTGAFRREPDVRRSGNASFRIEELQGETDRFTHLDEDCSIDILILRNVVLPFSSGGTVNASCDLAVTTDSEPGILREVKMFVYNGTGQCVGYYTIGENVYLNQEMPSEFHTEVELLNDYTITYYFEWEDMNGRGANMLYDAGG